MAGDLCRFLLLRSVEVLHGSWSRFQQRVEVFPKDLVKFYHGFYRGLLGPLLTPKP